MSWPWLLGACAAAYALKVVGFLVPERVLRRPRLLRVAGTMTIGLLAGLTALNTVADGTALVLDVRVLSLAAAAVALRLRAPFLVVVIVGVAVASLARAAGLP